MHSSGMRSVRNSSYLGGGGCLLQGGAWSVGEGVCSWGVPAPGWCTWSGEVSAPRGCLLLCGGCLVRGVPGLGGCLLPGGMLSQHALRQTTSVNRMTDRYKNLTFATSLRTVIILVLSNVCDTKWRCPHTYLGPKITIASTV